MSEKSAENEKNENVYDIEPIASAQSNLRFKNRNSYQPPGFKTATKNTQVSFSGNQTGQSASESSNDPNRAMKRKSYLPAGFVKKENATSEEAQQDTEKGKKRRSYMPPSVKKNHSPLIKIDLKRPASYAGESSSLDPAQKKEEKRSFDGVPRSKTAFDKSRAAASANKKLRLSNLIGKSQKDRQNNMNPTLINLEAGVSIISKAKAINHTLVAKYTPDDPSFFLDAESMAYLRGFFSIISATYIGWCVSYQRFEYFSNLVGWNWVGYLLYFSLSFAETLWYIEGNQKVMFPFQPEISDVLFVTISALAFATPAIYWTFAFAPYIRNLISNAPNTLDMIDVQNLVGVHLALFLIIPEIFLSRRYVEKMFAVIPSIAVISYFFLVWLLHYHFTWDWPASLSSFFISYFQSDMNPISLFLTVLVTAILIATSTIFVYLCCFWRGQLQKKKEKQAGSQRA